MTVYSLVLFLHVGAALALASVLSIDARSCFNCGELRVPLGRTFGWSSGLRFPG